MTASQTLLVFLRAAFLSANGSTTLALLEEDLVDRLHVLTPGDFALGVAVGAATPGPLGFGCIALGFLADGWRGALVAAFTSWLPALLSLPLRSLHRRFEGQSWLAGVTWGLAAAGSGLLLAMVYGMVLTGIPGWREGAIALGTLILLARGMHPAPVLFLAAAVGALWFR